MENFLLYIGKSGLAAGAFYLLFLALFQNKKQFLFNRIYLPVSLAISFLIPLITFTSVRYIETQTVNYAKSFAYLPEASVPAVAEPEMEWTSVLFLIYLAGTMLFLGHLLLGHYKAFRIVRTSKLTEFYGTIVNVTSKDVHPFSFFNKIVLSERTTRNPNLEMIVQHESIHVKERHTLDILAGEILFLFQWFNPFAWLIKDAMKNNLEYLTDHQVAQSHNPEAYQLTMVGLADKKGVAPFLTALNGSQLKNRIIMMKQNSENKYPLLKQLVVLPLLAVLIMGLSTKEVKTEIVQTPEGAIAQTSIDQIIIKGKVTGKNGIPLEEAVVYYTDRKQVIDKTLSDDEGNYEIEINGKDPLLVIRMDGYVSQTFELNKSEVLKVRLDEIKTNEERFMEGLPPQHSEISKPIDPIKIKGKVINEKGELLPGVAVLIKGTTIGTVTDIEGNYELKLEDDAATLVFMMVGFDQKEVEVNKQATINVKLTASKTAQEVFQVKGKITDEAGKALPGTAVFVKGTTVGTVTDIEGNYGLKLEDDAATLVFMMIGFDQKEVEV
ncbi:MAG: carboxypeptidase-like regulatory domain-containing protein, partial [Draconibacterium sp.]